MLEWQNRVELEFSDANALSIGVLKSHTATLNTINTRNGGGKAKKFDC